MLHISCWYKNNTKVAALSPAGLVCDIRFLLFCKPFPHTHGFIVDVVVTSVATSFIAINCSFIESGFRALLVAVISVPFSMPSSCFWILITANSKSGVGTSLFWLLLLVVLVVLHKPLIRHYVWWSMFTMMIFIPSSNARPNYHHHPCTTGNILIMKLFCLSWQGMKCTWCGMEKRSRMNWWYVLFKNNNF